MEKMNEALSHCQVCPRNCGIDRTAGQTGFCRAPYLPKVALVSRHDWEEPPISGTKGSGTVFFSHCNLGCVFCQNFNISQEGFGQEISVARLAEIFLEQQARGFHNVNLVSAAQFIPQAAKALEMAKEQGLSLNPVKISGTCGRLMCCLKYEQDNYEYLLKITPKQGALVDTPEGRGIVVEVNLLSGQLMVRLDRCPDAAPHSFNRREVKTIKDGKIKVDRSELEALKGIE